MTCFVLGWDYSDLRRQVPAKRGGLTDAGAVPGAAKSTPDVRNGANVVLVLCVLCVSCVAEHNKYKKQSQVGLKFM